MTGDRAGGPLVSLEQLAATPVSVLRTCTPKLQRELEGLGITSLLDLLEHFPRRYHDRRTRAAIGELVVGTEATVVAEVVRSAEKRSGKRVRVEVVVSDGQATLSLTFFNQAWRSRQLTPGVEAAFFGKVDRFNHRLQMVNPAVDILEPTGEARGGPGAEATGVIVPIYPESGKADVATWQLRRLVAEALERWPGLEDPLPADIAGRARVMPRAEAYRKIHRPEEDRDHFQARRRLVFDEFFRIQLELLRRRREFQATTRGIAHVVDGPLVTAFHDRLPFTLTAGQRAAIDEIVADMSGAHPMHRLLQGDVGAGKTVVAVTGLLVAVQGGHQGALLAPTEVLAEQHFRGIRALVEGLTVREEGSLMGERPVQARLLTNKTRGRDEITAAVAAGQVDILVGTHALLSEDVRFHSLGLVVVDEQHRFGVAQRAALLAKGANPDELVMTATPIPRSAAMLVYGHLDHSVMGELPAGRQPIETVLCRDEDERARAYRRIREEVAAGRQAYVVCPLVEGSETVEAKAAQEERDRLAEEELAGLELEALHGRMKPADKERVMSAFRDGAIDVLVATTVIEVGVDVPNATVMVIESADRFGLSQLHQLRGRVGRGSVASTCYLFADPSTPEGQARLEAMVDSTDGFHLAEVDLELRGGGQLFGDRQSGRSDLRLGRLPRDQKAVLFARAEAERLLADDPTLARHPGLATEVDWYLSRLDTDFANALRS
jgi:ATP-dependent DNA helicase RecG